MLDISVIIPIYNVKEYLRECLDSLEKQSLKNCEFICIDDGSEDNSYEIVEEYLGRDARFRLLRQENKGLAESRNVGINMAQGKYIACLDSDDYYTNCNSLETLYQEAEINNLEILSFETELRYEGSMKKNNNKDFYYYKKNIYEGVRRGQDFFVDMMSHNEYCDSACLLLIEKEWLLKSGIMFYPGILYEDALFCLQCFLQAERMAHLSKRLYTYRVREHSITTTQIYWENVRSRLVVYREILRLLFLFGDNDLQLQKCIADYLSLVAGHVKYLDEFRIDEQSDDVLEPLDDLLLNSLGLGKYRSVVNERVILAGLEKIVSESEGIVLYGAGDVGKLFFRFLDDKGLGRKVLCFAVSNPQKSKMEINGIPVLPIYDAIKKRCQIIVSVAKEKDQRDMQQVLIQLGVDRFEVCDKYIYQALRHYAQSINEIGGAEK